jgi:hypothetical protein
MLGSITELKAYQMLELRSREEGGGRRSTVPGFDNSLRHLFPEVDSEPDSALDIAERMLMLKRKVDRRISEAGGRNEAQAEAPRKRGLWPFGR